MGVIKQAFKEGRETNIGWSESNAKQNEIALDIFSSNMDYFNKKYKNTLICLEQIDPETGEMVDIFPNRLMACMWICNNVLNKSFNTYEELYKKAISITGNMHLCAMAGYKSYDYYWKYISKDDYNKRINELSQKYNSSKVWIRLKKNSAIYYSIKDASRKTGISEKIIRNRMRDYKLFPKMTWRYNKSIIISNDLLNMNRTISIQAIHNYLGHKYLKDTRRFLNTYDKIFEKWNIKDNKNG